MTKAVRIENADTANFKVLVQVYEKSGNTTDPDRLVSEHRLDYPTAMAGADGGLYLTSSRYIVVKETE